MQNAGLDESQADQELVALVIPSPSAALQEHACTKASSW